MLVNAAYCGYVCGLRSKDRSVRGQHEPLVEEELFDRVQEIRAWRTRVLKPGKPCFVDLLHLHPGGDLSGSFLRELGRLRPLRTLPASTLSFGDNLAAARNPWALTQPIQWRRWYSQEMVLDMGALACAAGSGGISS